jgi:hypothetical protein
MPLGPRPCYDRFVPPGKRDTHTRIWGWKGLVRRDCNMTELPTPGRPLYGELARREIKRLRKRARALGVTIGPISALAFRRVLASKHPLDWGAYRSVTEWLDKVERDQAAGIPYIKAPRSARPPARFQKGQSGRVQAPAPAPQPAAVVGLSIRMPGSGRPSLALRVR